MSSNIFLTPPDVSTPSTVLHHCTPALLTTSNSPHWSAGPQIAASSWTSSVRSPLRFTEHFMGEKKLSGRPAAAHLLISDNEWKQCWRTTISDKRLHAHIHMQARAHTHPHTDPSQLIGSYLSSSLGLHVLLNTEFKMSFVKSESTPLLMKLIYMEITHNTDNSQKDLSSLLGREELIGRVCSLLFYIGHSRSCSLGCGWLCVCLVENVYVNSRPCGDPAEVEPSRLRLNWSITLSAWPEKSLLRSSSTCAHEAACVFSFPAELIHHDWWMQASCHCDTTVKLHKVDGRRANVGKTHPDLDWCRKISIDLIDWQLRITSTELSCIGWYDNVHSS